MKQKLALVLALSLFGGMLTGCAGTPVVYYTECKCTDECACVQNNDTVNTQEVTTEAAAEAATEVVTEAATEVATEAAEVATEVAEVATEAATEAAAEGALKTGLAIVASVAKSEEAVQADYDVTHVAVLVDDNGVIQDCIIDGIASKVTFDATGTITGDVNSPVATKNELGENYGMVAYGDAKYEWFEQADALAQYAVGKTVEELKNGAIDETGKAPEGTDLAATATIYLGGYVSAIEAAVENAKHLGAQAGDELRLASINGVDGSASATAEAEGVAQLDSTVTALTVNGDVITSCYIDSVQAKVNFDQEGKISTDLTAPVLTKNQLGENYGMVAWGGAVAEWDAQAASFAEYVTGKTAAEVAGIAVNEKTAPADADLASSVTIAIGGFQALIEKAMQ